MPDSVFPSKELDLLHQDEHNTKELKILNFTQFTMVFIVKDRILHDKQSRNKTYADKAKLTKELGRAPCEGVRGNRSFLCLILLCKQMMEDN